MQQIKPIQTGQVSALPVPESSQNKPIYPVSGGSAPKAGGLLGNTQPLNKPNIEPVSGSYTASNTMQTTAAGSPPRPTDGGNRPANYNVPIKPAPQTEFTPREYQSNGFEGVTSDKQYQYDPREESLVQNQITGLLDPNSDIMRKAIANANGLAASRGLQSSSIGSELALSSMIDKALPIAQQDAQTYNQAQSQQWQTQAQQDQLNLKNQQDAAMADKQYDANNQLQNNQMEWQTGENNANREFQQQLEDLKYRQQLGTLDKQQELQLKQMETSHVLQVQRDSILQQYQVELNQLQNDQRWKELTAQLGTQMEMQMRGFDQQTKMEYGNATGQAVNAALQAIGMAMTNPNMTQAQQQAAVKNIIDSLKSQTAIIGTIYGIGGNSGPAPDVGVPPPTTSNPGGTVGAGTGGGSGGSFGGGSSSTGGLLGGSGGGWSEPVGTPGSNNWIHQLQR